MNASRAGPAHNAPQGVMPREGPVMTSQCLMRASDRDRDRAVKVLRDAFAAGRLDIDEFNARAGVAFEARDWEQLYGLVADLPEGQSLIRAGFGADQEADEPCWRPFAPLWMMAVIWLGIAAAVHVAAVIPLVLLSLFLLQAARSNSAKRWPPPGTPDAQRAAWQAAASADMPEQEAGRAAASADPATAPQPATAPGPALAARPAVSWDAAQRWAAPATAWETAMARQPMPAGREPPESRLSGT